jgi:hypothetical protein
LFHLWSERVTIASIRVCGGYLYICITYSHIHRTERTVKFGLRSNIIICAFESKKARLTDSADLVRAYLIQGDAPKVHYNNKIFCSPKVIVKFVWIYMFEWMPILNCRCNCNNSSIDCTFTTREFVFRK